MCTLKGKKKRHYRLERKRTRRLEGIQRGVERRSNSIRWISCHGSGQKRCMHERSIKVCVCDMGRTQVSVVP